jgi:DUF4097 and DUF4098 domain-containing protein YvlB
MLRTFATGTHILLLTTLLVMATNVQAGDLQDIKDTVRRSFRVQPGGTLFLEIDHGSVEVRSHAGSDVLVEVERSVETDNEEMARRMFAHHELSMAERGGNVYVDSRARGQDGFWSRMRSSSRLKIHVTVRIPSAYNVEFSTGAGNVDVGDVAGRVLGRTGAGNVSVGAVTGPVRVSSGSGNVTIVGARGPVDVNTGAGNVEVREVHGEIRVNTGAGNVQAFITRQPQEESSLTSGAGNVTVFLAQGVGVRVDAEAGLGTASTDFPLPVEGQWMKKSFAGEVNGGGPPLRLRAGVGNVALRRP